MDHATSLFARNPSAVARSRWGWREDILRCAATSTTSYTGGSCLRMPLEIRPFDASFVDAAATLLAARHRAASELGQEPSFACASIHLHLPFVRHKI